jgi:hypothetical protein
MKAPLIARILGILFTVAGVLGFLPWTAVAADMTAPYVTLSKDYALLFGLFPVNVVHDGVHLVFGLWGLFASFQFARSVGYLRFVGWIYILLAILGTIPITNTLFGIAPVYGHDIWLHVLMAILAIYGGFGPPSREELGEAPLAPPPLA